MEKTVYIVLGSLGQVGTQDASSILASFHTTRKSYREKGHEQ